MNDDNRRLAEKFLPLIEEERRAFIRAEHGRLLRLIGAEYWRPRGEKAYFFHRGAEEEALPADPYELSLGELAMLPGLEKRVERLGTYSYLAFFQMFPRDRERLAFLSGLWLRLTKGLGCTEAEAERLTGGHDGYLAWKRGDTVRVIVPEGWGAHAGN